MATLSGKPADTDAELRSTLSEAALGVAALVGLFLFVLGVCGLCDRLDHPGHPDPHAAARPEAEE